MLQFFGVFFLSKDRVWFSLPWTYVRLRTLLYWRECNRSDAMWFPRPVHERDGFHLGPPPLLLFWRKPAAMLWGHSSRPEAFFFFPPKSTTEAHLLAPNLQVTAALTNSCSWSLSAIWGQKSCSGADSHRVSAPASTGMCVHVVGPV